MYCLQDLLFPFPRLWAHPFCRWHLVSSIGYLGSWSWSLNLSQAGFGGRDLSVPWLARPSGRGQVPQGASRPGASGSKQHQDPRAPCRQTRGFLISYSRQNQSILGAEEIRRPATAMAQCWASITPIGPTSSQSGGLATAGRFSAKPKGSDCLLGK